MSFALKTASLQTLITISSNLFEEPSKAMRQPAYLSCFPSHPDFYHVKGNTGKISILFLQPQQRCLSYFLLLGIRHRFPRGAVFCSGTSLYFHKMHGSPSLLYVYPSPLPVFIPSAFLPKDGICIRFRHIDCYQVQFPPAAVIIPLCNDQAFPFQKFRRDFFASPSYFLLIENNIIPSSGETKNSAILSSLFKK